MNLQETLNNLPEGNKVVIILSGGLDSTIAMRLAVEKYGAENVSALTFFYGQRQAVEITRAMQSCTSLGVYHQVINTTFLGEISQGFSANVDRNVAMPTIQDVLGDPTPKTYVPNRNMILLSIAAAFAETRGAELVFCGLQSTDTYGYWDTTSSFVEALNSVLVQNRKIKIKVLAPFSHLSKHEELDLLEQMDGNIDLVKWTLTCYDPDDNGVSCGKCPSCSERIMNFAKAGHIDPVSYAIDIPWDKLISQ